MNALVRIAVLLLAFATFARAQDNASDQKAIEAYRRGDLESARTEWLAQLNADDSPRGEERARILYDLGNVAFRDQKQLEAVGWYTSSLRLRPRDSDTWANLEQARSAAKLEPADRGDLSATLARLVTAFTRGESEWLALLGLAVLGATLGFEAFRGGRTWRVLSLVAALLVLVLATPWVGQLVRSGSDPMLVVEPDKVLVKSEPRTNAAVIAESPAGSEVERIDQLPDWTKIRLEGGVEGWVAKSSVFALVR